MPRAPVGTAEGPVWTSACVSISLSPALSMWMVFLRSPKDWDGKKEVGWGWGEGVVVGRGSEVGILRG